MRRYYAPLVLVAVLAFAAPAQADVTASTITTPKSPAYVLSYGSNAVIDVAGTSDWSPDGQWVVVGGEEGQSRGLFKISVDSGERVRLTTGPA